MQLLLKAAVQRAKAEYLLLYARIRNSLGRSCEIAPMGSEDAAADRNSRQYLNAERACPIIAVTSTRTERAAVFTGALRQFVRGLEHIGWLRRVKVFGLVLERVVPLAAGSSPGA